MVQGAASRRDGYILAHISCKLEDGKLLATKKKAKTTGQLFVVKDPASLPGRSRKQWLFETESVSVFSRRSH